MRLSSTEALAIVNECDPPDREMGVDGFTHQLDENSYLIVRWDQQPGEWAGEWAEEMVKDTNVFDAKPDPGDDDWDQKIDSWMKDNTYTEVMLVEWDVVNNCPLSLRECAIRNGKVTVWHDVKFLHFRRA